MAAKAAINEYEDSKDSQYRHSTITKSEALQLALDSNLASQQTSFLAVSDERSENGFPSQRVIPHLIEDNEDRFGGPDGPVQFASAPIQATFRCDAPDATRGGGHSRARSIGFAGLSMGALQSVTQSLCAKKGKARCGAPRRVSMEKMCLDRASCSLSESRAESADESDDHSEEMDDTDYAMVMESSVIDCFDPASRPSGLIEGEKKKQKKPSLSSCFAQMGPPPSAPTAPLSLLGSPPAPPPPSAPSPSSVPPKCSAPNLARRCLARDPKPQIPKPKLNEDCIYELCLQQKADGSFEASEVLAQLLGLLVQQFKDLALQLGLEEDVVATIAVIEAFSRRFADARDQWELQQAKGLRYLASRGVSDSNVKGVSDWFKDRAAESRV
eukprot:CAMPEP_0184306358 /NCGR_PEP_ID=MMETSP1049-20130417/15369_1 /TAXON_ID=77928 /ORGANISM="Proteomonas sulcata, Strain CCMP704" /LENGTH=384 /DNA_ID=CAMNT_0026618599 /DNA_START=26 /DNA_END=1180 /DNA_ORIENTATION=+